MTDRSSNNTGDATPRKKPWACYGVTLVLVGAVMLGVDRWHTGRLTRYPAVIPLSMQAGESRTVDFVTDLGTTYEIEVIARQDVAYDEVRRLLMAMEKPSELDLRWSVLESGAVVASGNCRDYRHVIEFRDGMVGRVAKYFLKRTNRQAFTGPPTVARGVGRFDAEPGKTYQLKIDVPTAHPSLAPAQPEAVVTPNLRRLNDHFASTRWLSIGGVIAIALGLVATVIGPVVNKLSR